MPGKKVKKSQSFESDDSESKPLVRGAKKIIKKKPQQDQKSKPQKTTPQKNQKSKQTNSAKQAKPKQKPTEVKSKDEKKNYLPGQRHQTPPDTDGAKAFYLSLLEQCPNNAMAEKWCLDYGCLDYADAVQRVKKYEKSKR